MRYSLVEMVRPRIKGAAVRLRVLGVWWLDGRQHLKLAVFQCPHQGFLRGPGKLLKWFPVGQKLIVDFQSLHQGDDVIGRSTRVADPDDALGIESDQMVGQIVAQPFEHHPEALHDLFVAKAQVVESEMDAGIHGSAPLE